MSRSINASGVADRFNETIARRQRAPARETVGQAFSLPELMILSAWAEYHDLRLVIELDTCVDGAEYEEVAALYRPRCGLRRWTIWRDAEAVVLEQMNRPSLRMASMAELLESLDPALI